MDSLETGDACVLFHEKTDKNIQYVRCFREETLLLLSSKVIFANCNLPNGSDCIVIDPRVVFQRQRTDIEDEGFVKVLTEAGIRFVRPQHVRRIDDTR